MRQATKHDIPELVEMMRQYAKEGPVKVLGLPLSHNEAHVSRLLFEMIAGRGFVLIEPGVAMLAAIIIPNVWCPDINELHELAWWVDPNRRHRTVGGRLWVEFNRIATEMLAYGRVDVVCTTVMSTSPPIDYTKRGYKPLEATFFKE